MQGGATKLKEYMRSLNILPQKRKRKPSDGIPRSPRSPRSPDGLLPGDSSVTLRHAQMRPAVSISLPGQSVWALDTARANPLPAFRASWVTSEGETPCSATPKGWR